MTDKIKYVCPACGGEQFNKYFQHDWNIAAQKWEPFYEGHTECTNCLNTVEPKAVVLTEEQAQ
jgi:hypothetical protein